MAKTFSLTYFRETLNCLSINMLSVNYHPKSSCSKFISNVRILYPQIINLSIHSIIKTIIQEN